MRQVEARCSYHYLDKQNFIKISSLSHIEPFKAIPCHAFLQSYGTRGSRSMSLQSLLGHDSRPTFQCAQQYTSDFCTLRINTTPPAKQVQYCKSTKRPIHYLNTDNSEKQLTFRYRFHCQASTLHVPVDPMTYAHHTPTPQSSQLRLPSNPPITLAPHTRPLPLTPPLLRRVLHHPLPLLPIKTLSPPRYASATPSIPDTYSKTQSTPRLQPPSSNSSAHLYLPTVVYPILPQSLLRTRGSRHQSLR